MYSNNFTKELKWEKIKKRIVYKVVLSFLEMSWKTDRIFCHSFLDVTEVNHFWEMQTREHRLEVLYRGPNKYKILGT